MSNRSSRSPRAGMTVPTRLPNVRFTAQNGASNVGTPDGKRSCLPAGALARRPSHRGLKLAAISVGKVLAHLLSLSLRGLRQLEVRPQVLKASPTMQHHELWLSPPS